jgi:DNA anti-recombination protein RmuC
MGGHLEEMGGHLKEATGTFHSAARDMTAQLGKMANQVESVENQIEVQVQRLQSLQESLSNASMEFQGSASLASEGFKALENHQRAFLESMRDNFGLITKTLRIQVEELEKQAEQWLRAYAEEVSRQTTDRMAQWDDQTRGFADNVGRSVQAISDVVDEIEGKVVRHAS